MGDEINAFDLPQSSQSGNVDVGHLSEDVQSEENRLIQEATVSLNNNLNDYFGGHISSGELYQTLIDQGYTESQSERFLNEAETEQNYRLVHNNEPSGLSPNQLDYLRNLESRRQTTLDFSKLSVQTDDDGNLYINDFSRRDLDGGPIEIILPTARPLDPLTSNTRSELELDEGYLSHITLQDPESDVSHLYNDTIDQQTIHQVSQLITQYLTLSDEQRTDRRRFDLYHNIQQLRGIQNQNNVRAKLVDLFNSIDLEEQYRIDNNGRPRGLTNSQWESLQNNPNYYGQVILQTPTDPPVKYIVSAQYYIQIDDNIDNPPPQRRLTNENIDRINLIATDYLTNPDTSITPDDLRNNLRNAVHLDLNNDRDFNLRFQLDDTVDRLQQEREYRSENFGKPSQISALQYEFLLNHTLVEGEPRYTGEELITQTRPDGRSVVGFTSWDNQIPEFIIIPTDDLIQTFIQTGDYTRPSRPPQQRPAPTIDPRIPPSDPPAPDFRDQRLITVIGQNRFDSLSQNELDTLRSAVDAKENLTVAYNRLGRDAIPITDANIPSITGVGLPHLPRPSVIPQAPPTFDPPIVEGITQPIDIRTGEDIPLDTPERNIERYERYFNSQQREYTAFRNMFRDILPIFSGFAGGFFAFSYARSRDRGTMGEILQNERVFLEQMDERIRIQQDTIQNLQTDRQRERTQRDTGYMILQNLNLQRGQLAGTEDDPDANPEQLQGLVAQSSQDLQRSNRDLRIIQNQIREAEQELNNLQEQINNDQLTRPQINQRIDNLIELDNAILQNVYRYNPQILQGFQIGTTLGLVLSGYFFPTYVDIEDDEYFNREKTKENDKKPTNKKRDIPIDNDIKISQSRKLPNEEKNKIVKPPIQNFIPSKDNRGKPLSYQEIQELKSTLSQNELNNLKGKYLVFGDDNKPSKFIDDKCKGYVGETQIFKRPIKLR